MKLNLTEKQTSIFKKDKWQAETMLVSSIERDGKRLCIQLSTFSTSRGWVHLVQALWVDADEKVRSFVMYEDYCTRVKADLTRGTEKAVEQAHCKFVALTKFSELEASILAHYRNNMDGWKIA